MPLSRATIVAMLQQIEEALSRRPVVIREIVDEQCRVITRLSRTEPLGRRDPHITDLVQHLPGQR